MIKVTIYRRWTIKGRQWFWRARSTQNGKVMAVGGEGYFNLADAEQSIGRLRTFMPLAEIEIKR